MRALVVGVAVAAAVVHGAAPGFDTSACDFEGVRIAHRSSKYIVGRANKRGSIYGSCDGGHLTCFEDTGLADAPLGLNARVIDCDSRLVNSRRRKLGVAINLLEDKWPNGLVWYRFSTKNPLADNEREMVRNAIKMYEATDLGVAFQECEPTTLCNNKYVDIGQKEDACYSYVGFTGEGGGQIMNLGKSCFEEPGTAVHELGHALGLYHEHTHPQREVIVLTDGNLPVSASNYAKETDANLKPYDKASIMHYGRSAGLCLPKDQYPLESFCDVEITTNCVMPKKTHCNNTRNNEIGQRTQLSPGDLNTLKAIYGTNKPTLKPTTAPSATTSAPSSTTATPSPSTTTPKPSTTTPAPPSTTAPVPTTTQPAPTTTAPAPTTATPAPTTATPEPTTKTPMPTTRTPESTTTTPEPTTKTPESTTTTPESTTKTPKPTKTQKPSTATPVPTTTKPESTTNSPAPKTKKPVPTTEPPAPTTTAPAPTTVTPVPTKVTPVPTTATPVPVTAEPEAGPRTTSPVPETTQSAPSTTQPTPKTKKPTTKPSTRAPTTTSPTPNGTSPAPAPSTLIPTTTPLPTDPEQQSSTTPSRPTKAPSTSPVTISPSPLTRTPTPVTPGTPVTPRTVAPPPRPAQPTTPVTITPPVAPKPVAPTPLTFRPTAAPATVPVRPVAPVVAPTARPVQPVATPKPAATEYNPGSVKPDTEQNSAWWAWWNTKGYNKRWADKPWANGNGRWWGSASASVEVSGDSDNPAKQSVSTKKTTTKPTPKPKPTKKPKTPKPAPTKKKGIGYSFRGWGQ